MGLARAVERDPDHTDRARLAGCVTAGRDGDRARCAVEQPFAHRPQQHPTERSVVR